MQRQTEYRSHFVSHRSASSTGPVGSGRPKVSSGRTMPASKEASQFHLRKSASDMISATAVAIPTARTHRSPKKTVFTRTTYSVVRTPNVSAVHNDPYAALPSTDISTARGFAVYPTTASSSRRDTGARSQPPAPRAASAHLRDRAIQNKMDVVMAKNRELEMQLLHLRREMMMVKAASTSSTRLNPPPTKRVTRRCATPQTSATDRRSYSQQPALLSPRRPANVPTEHSRALHLVDELRDALAHSSTVINNSGPKKKKKHPSKKRVQNGPEASADMLRNAIYEEQRQYGNTSRWSGGLQSPQRSTKHTTRHSMPVPVEKNGDDDDDFDSLQRSYWSQSQAILDQLDRKLREITAH